MTSQGVAMHLLILSFSIGPRGFLLPCSGRWIVKLLLHAMACWQGGY